MDKLITTPNALLPVTSQKSCHELHIAKLLLMRREKGADDQLDSSTLFEEINIHSYP